jgi:hypothetical protein
MMRRLESAETERLRLERWDHDAHAPGLAAVNAHADVSLYLGGGQPILRPESDELSLAVYRRLGMAEEPECPHPSREHMVRVLRVDEVRA